MSNNHDNSDRTEQLRQWSAELQQGNRNTVALLKQIQDEARVSAAGQRDKKHTPRTRS